MNTILHSIKDKKKFDILKKLRKNQLIRIQLLENNKIVFYRGKILSIHKAGMSSTFLIRRKIRGIRLDINFPLFAPFLRQIEIIY
uniref:Ribosomal protein l19 n=1 Tax=Prototheca stagnorum TaxID=215448 RepID=A0A2Z6BEN2_9CHLO|nr:ribosomal protein l19 [Prototheca stagnorum]BBD20183.1 ribosomal protein l19 [Prototheca stagnorum]